VSALRLAEKGYRVAVLESGRRFEDHDFAERLSQLSRTIFAPKLGLKGILRVTPFKDVMVLTGSGVGAAAWSTRKPSGAPATVLRGLAQVCGDAPDLEKYYEVAEGMLGVVTQPRRTPATTPSRPFRSSWGGRHLPPVPVASTSVSRRR